MVGPTLELRPLVHTGARIWGVDRCTVRTSVAETVGVPRSIGQPWGRRKWRADKGRAGCSSRGRGVLCSQEPLGHPRGFERS